VRTGAAYLDGRVLFSCVEEAVALKDRLRGLLGRDGLTAGAGMLLSSCGSIHSFGMRFSLDVLFLDRHYRIVTVRRGLRPNRMAWGGFRARHALEAQTGWLDAAAPRRGSSLEFVWHSL
jgi:uncharacterized membrane protein (UPF0127 family)